MVRELQSRPRERYFPFKETRKAQVNPRIAEILIHLLRRIAEAGAEAELPLELLVEELVGLGFNTDDVQLAVGWLGERMEHVLESPVESQHNPVSRRVLHQAETHYLTPEARSMLAELQNAQSLHPGETEAVIERALWMERTHTSIDELRDYVQQVMLGQGNLEPGQEFRVVNAGAASRH